MPSFDNRAVNGNVGPSVTHTHTHTRDQELLLVKMSTGARGPHLVTKRYFQA